MGDTEGFLIATEVSNNSPVAQSELCGHQHTPKQYEPRSVAAIQLPSTNRAGRYDAFFILPYISPYRLRIVQEQSDSNCASRSAFCEQFVTLVNEHVDVIRHWIKSDEAHFEQTKYAVLE